MMTAFQAMGAIAGTPKISYEFRMPVTTPVIPRIATIGNIHRESETTRSGSMFWFPGTKSGINHGAIRTNSAESAPSTTAASHRTMLATRHASGSRPSSRSCAKTGTNAAEIALSATRLRTRFGTLKAIRKAPSAGLEPKKLAATISRTTPATRDTAVAAPNAAVDAARRLCSLIGARVYRPAAMLPRPRRKAGVRVSISKGEGGQLEAASQAGPNGGASAAREPALPPADQDALPAAVGGRRGGRIGAGRRRPTAARRRRRPCRRPAGDPPQHGRAPQGPRRPDRQPGERLRVTRPSRISVTPVAW